jgi:hypothetical protein
MLNFGMRPIQSLSVCAVLAGYTNSADSTPLKKIGGRVLSSELYHLLTPRLRWGYKLFQTLWRCKVLADARTTARGSHTTAFAYDFCILAESGPLVKMEVSPMNKEAMRKQMEDIRDELNRLDSQRVALEQILRGYEAWFRAFPENGAQPHQQLTLPVSGRGGATKGAMSFRNGFIEVLKQARGEPLTDEEIWRRMQEKGVKSDARRPLGIVALTAKRHSNQVEMVAVKTWRWKGPVSIGVPTVATNHKSGESH